MKKKHNVIKMMNQGNTKKEVFRNIDLIQMSEDFYSSIGHDISDTEVKGRKKGDKDSASDTKGQFRLKTARSSGDRPYGESDPGGGGGGTG